jgi:hypothetical protein
LGVWALVAGALAGSAAYLIGSYIVAPYRPRLAFNRNAARSLIRFGQWIFFTSLVAMAGQSTLRLVIARQLGAAELGLYYLAASLAFLPYDVASQVVGQVAFPFYSRLQTDIRQVSLAFRSILTSLSALLVPACALLIALAPSLVENVLGPDWQGTAAIIRVLALASIADLLGSAIAPILQGMGRPDRILVIEAVPVIHLDCPGLAVGRPVWSRWGGHGLVARHRDGTDCRHLFLRQILPRPFAGLACHWCDSRCFGHSGRHRSGRRPLVPGVFGLLLAGLTGLILIGFLLWILERRFALGISDGLVRAFPRVAALVGFSPG